MPTLCVFADLHNINLLLYKSPDSYWFENFPYVYSRPVFSSSFSEETFYSAIFDDIFSRHDLKPDSCDIAITAFIEPPVFTDAFNTKYNITSVHPVSEVVKQINAYYPILVTSHTICTRDYCTSNGLVRSLGTSIDKLDIEEENYYANLELYPQALTTDLSVQLDIDTNLSMLLDQTFNTTGKASPKRQKPDLLVEKDIPIVFSGSRFTQRSLFKELDYLLMLNFIRKAGVYDIRRDSESRLVLGTLLNMHTQKQTLEPELNVDAAVITSKFSLECAIQTDLGTSQLLQLEKNRILLIPTSKDERIKLSIKSKDIGTFETTVDGGNAGLIFDTRENKTLTPQDIKVFAMGLKSFKSLPVARSNSSVDPTV